MEIIKKGILLLLLCSTIIAKGQINFQDSSVQVISYWDLGEKYEYSVSLQKLKYTDKDTSSNETVTYDVEVSVIDSTKDSYIVRWFYKNFKSDSKNPIVQRIAALAEDIAVDIKIDELGAVESIANLEEVRTYMMKSLDSLKKDYAAIPAMDKVFQQMEKLYANKSSLEATAIKDVRQFHTFHGGKYILNETATGQIKTANIYDKEKPFDTKISVVLEALDSVNNDYIIRSIQEVDAKQLTETTFKYLKNLTEQAGKEFIKEEDFIELKNSIETVSRIHNTGWVIESVLWKEVVAEGKTNMEIRRIEMK